MNNCSVFVVQIPFHDNLGTSVARMNGAGYE